MKKSKHTRSGKEQVRWEGYDCTLCRSDRRTLSLAFSPEGEILIRMPQHMPAAQAHAFFTAHLGWIDVHQRRIRERNSFLGQESEAALIARAKEILPGRVQHYARQMGLAPAGIRITRARRRYGSCSAAGRICFSCYLMRYPERAVDYVVVHELAHLVHLNHSAAFYALVGQILPDYKERIKLLNHYTDGFEE